MAADVPRSAMKTKTNAVSAALDIELDASLRIDMNGMTMSNLSEDIVENSTSVAKKKKRKRTKKNGAKSKTSGTVDSEALSSGPSSSANVNANANVLCISRNKHWKYISSYHGPWLQLPVELLESLLILNLDPATVSSELCTSCPSSEIPSPPSQQRRLTGFARLRDRSNSLITLPSSPCYRHSQPASPTRTSLTLPPLMPPAGKAAPPPLDPGVFRSVISIRRLIDEAAELSVRASSGLSAAALGSLQSASGGSGGGGTFGLNGNNGNPWAAAQALGLNPLNEFGGGGTGGGSGGRNTSMSATRVHRLRALAVQKLAEAYKTDEIASSVMVMQRGTVFDDIAERVLKFDPKNVDALYVHFFHEKIPSRQLAEYTSTAVLDQLIAENPQRLEFYRTRGVVHCFRDEYAFAAKDFTHVIRESRAVRRARQAHGPAQRSDSENRPKGKRRKNRLNGQAPPDGTASAIEGPNCEQLLIHPSVLPYAPEPIELQSLFLRGAAYFARALFLIEESIFKLEEIPRIPLNDFGEMHLSYIHGKYGGIEINNPDGPLGRSDGAKAHAYRAVFGESPVREQVYALLRKSKRDHEKFLAHFDSLEPSTEMYGAEEYSTDPLQKMDRAFALLDKFRPMNRQHETPSVDTAVPADTPLAFTTYHPLMLESHFSILNCLLMLGEFEALASVFERTAGIVAGLEGYPVFLTPRSMAQAEFVETLERLAGSWKYGKLPNALVRVRTSNMSPPLHDESPASTPLLVVTDDDTGIVSCSSAGPSTSTSCSTKTSPASRRRPSLSSDFDFESPGVEADPHASLRSSLEALRFLLAPVRTRLRLRAERERAANEKGEGAGMNAIQLSLQLHGAHVEVFLAWLGAVHLFELEAVAMS